MEKFTGILLSSWEFGLKITRSTQRLNYNLKRLENNL